MSIAVVPIPALRDNYIWLLCDEAQGAAVIVDPPEAAPALAALKERGLRLEIILNTHHHWDHTGGIAAVKEATGAHVFGPPGSSARIPVDAETGEGERITVLGRPVEVLSVPGHTLDHIAYWFPEDGILLCGDTLFAMGCGRIFEGTPTGASHCKWSQAIRRFLPACGRWKGCAPRDGRPCRPRSRLSGRRIRFCAPSLRRSGPGWIWRRPRMSLFLRACAP